LLVSGYEATNQRTQSETKTYEMVFAKAGLYIQRLM